uniref:Uncharacterized protein n=1 Tax=Setaria viridis TaxID=4556 RepID=A0A4V6DFH7_SETVI|nr:hypothetical protein SEVIR_1G154301v2 [Setaria viridis]
MRSCLLHPTANSTDGVTSSHVRRVGVQGRPCPPRGTPRPGGRRVVVGRRRAAQGAGARPQRRGGDVVRGAGAAAAGARVGALRERPVPAPLPPALHRAPHLRAPGLRQVQARAHVRHRRQDPQRLRGARRCLIISSLHSRPAGRAVAAHR